MTTTALDRYRRALLAAAAEHDLYPDTQEAAAAAREAAAGEDLALMRWILVHPYGPAPRTR